MKLHRSWLIAIGLLMALGCSNPPSTGDSGDAAVSDANHQDVPSDFLIITDAQSTDATDVFVDAPPVPLPGTWRLVGFSSQGINGMTNLTNVDTFVPGGNARVNGLMTLSATRLQSSIAVMSNGQVAIDPNATPSNAMSVFGTDENGTLDTFAFHPSSQSDVAFGFNLNGTIRQHAVAGPLGAVDLTWKRIDVIAARTAFSAQGLVPLLHPAMSAPMRAPRAAIAWDRPLPEGGVVYSNDVPLTFISTGTAAFNLVAGNIPPDALTSLGGTQTAIGYVIVYDDRNGNAQYDIMPGTDLDAGLADVQTDDSGDDIDGGGGTADILRGVSRIGLGWRAIGDPSAAFLASPMRDLLPGLQFVLVRDDSTVPGGVSVGPFDPTLLVTPDAFVETGPATLGIPDIVQ